MPIDLLIRDGLVVDGTGEKGRHADVAISDGKIREIGKIRSQANRTIDASDCVVGFDKCNDHMPCAQHDLYKPIRQRLKDYLKTTTLADLAASLRSKQSWRVVIFLL